MRVSFARLSQSRRTYSAQHNIDGNATTTTMTLPRSPEEAAERVGAGAPDIRSGADNKRKREKIEGKCARAHARASSLYRVRQTAINAADSHAENRSFDREDTGVFVSEIEDPFVRDSLLSLDN